MYAIIYGLKPNILKNKSEIDPLCCKGDVLNKFRSGIRLKAALRIKCLVKQDNGST